VSRQDTLPQLVFSTRAAEPSSGTDFVREIVAASSRVDEAARGELAGRADLVGTVLQADLDTAGPIFTFSSFGDGAGGRRWLVARTVSVGHYRKGHQLLTHGLVLDRDQLDALGGNPFLLATPERSPFLDRHPMAPGGPGEALPAATVRWPTDPRRDNAERLDRLSARLAAGHDSVAGGLLSVLTAGERAVWAVDSPTPELAEWLLLHLHPADRPELSLTTWYSHDRPVPYDLALCRRDDARTVRSALRPSVVATGDVVSGAPLGPGPALVALRTRGAAVLGEGLRRYRLTFLERGGSHPPLAAASAAPALAELAGEELSPEERRSVRRLRLRGEADDPTERALELLAETLRHEPERLEVSLAEVVGSLSPQPAAELDRLVASRSGLPLEERLACLVLWTGSATGRRLATGAGRARAVRQLVSPEVVAPLRQVARDLAGTTPILDRVLSDLLEDAGPTLTLAHAPTAVPLLDALGRRIDRDADDTSHLLALARPGLALFHWLEDLARSGALGADDLPAFADPFRRLLERSMEETDAEITMAHPDWAPLLEDDLRRRPAPPRGIGDDPRPEALARVAWRRWREHDRGAQRAAALGRLLRLEGSGGAPVAAEIAHLPAGLRAEARATLASGGVT
jgi:hypothetical protein